MSGGRGFRGGSLLTLMAILSMLLGPGAGAQEPEAPAPAPPVEEILLPPQPLTRELLDVVPGGVLSARVGSGRLLTLEADVLRVALADEAVARVQVVTAREILLSGRTIGRTTLFVWLRNGERVRFEVQVIRDLGTVRTALAELAPGISVEAADDGTSVMLVGEVDDAATAEEARARAEAVLAAQGAGPVQVMSLLRYPLVASASDLWLTEALHAIDPRIRLRRIQVGAEPEPALDSYILEGRVRTTKDLERAVILAERQLGGSGVRVEAPVQELSLQRSQGFLGTGAGGGAAAALQRPRAGLAAQVARGLTITSQSGRVLSLLEVDELPQVMVSVRVYEIDRAKAKRVGINFRFDSEHLSLGSFTGPQAGNLPRLLEGQPDVSQIAGGNLVAAFVDQTLAIAAAIDFLEDKELARAVAEPNILTLSGEEATLLVGGEVPIPTTAVGQVTTVQGFFFQTFGVQLDIRPTVDDDGIVALEVSPSIIRPAPGLGVGQVPGFQVQSVQTTARVPAGQSLVLGGLLTFDEGFEESRVPVLGKIPLFRWRRRSRQEQELLFVITPRLVAMPGPPQSEPYLLPSGDELTLPPMEWPEGEGDLRVTREPETLYPTGVPEEFLRLAPPETALAAPRAAPAAAGPGEPQIEAPLPPQASEPPPPPPVLEEAPPPPAAERWVVGTQADRCLNFRSRPSLLGQRLDCLPPGTEVEILDRIDTWVRVALADGRAGWVASGYLEPTP